MKIHICQLTVALCAATLLSAARAADEKPAAKEEKRELRVLSVPDRERRVFIHRDGDKGEQETVAFLGVETAAVSAVLGSQLGLQRGTGLVVNHVVAKSPAAGVLKEHDILLKLDDQILIETRQLSVLIRGHKEGDDVTVTYLRGGQKSTATIKLGKHEVPKLSLNAGANIRAFASAFGGQDGTFEFFTPGADGEREHLDRVLSLIDRARAEAGGAAGAHSGGVAPAVRFQIESGKGPGFRAMSVNPGNSNLVFSDTEGVLELKMAGGVKSLVAKNTKGEPVFSGPVTTPEERKAVPAEIRVRLEKLEGMRDVTFRTDGDFEGAETTSVRPRGIVWPLPAPAPRVTPPGFF